MARRGVEGAEFEGLFLLFSSLFLSFFEALSFVVSFASSKMEDLFNILREQNTSKSLGELQDTKLTIICRVAHMFLMSWRWNITIVCVCPKTTND